MTSVQNYEDSRKKQTQSAGIKSVPLLDLARQHGPLLEEFTESLQAVCRSGQFVLGPEVVRLEESVAEYSQTKHAVGCASGSDALLLALMACGVGPADEVIVPSFTFFATASAVARLGATPVFADIEPDTFNICPVSVESLINPATKVIIPVHLFGQCADMDRIGEIAENVNLEVIEDAAQAIGSEFAGSRAGSMGNIGCFSFYPTKNLG
ncbi:MAG: aminotransferase class I/II-fold pyridoxal phosphate-dependent enzyme, partial [Pirellulales bacterium]|nr:aminotransferase class I/II-fold pyridoxal phosphate-dependent enzyme [Pirellulales bacterium]